MLLIPAPNVNAHFNIQYRKIFYIFVYTSIFIYLAFRGTATLKNATAIDVLWNFDGDLEPTGVGGHYKKF